MLFKCLNSETFQRTRPRSIHAISSTSTTDHLTCGHDDNKCCPDSSLQMLSRQGRVVPGCQRPVGRSWPHTPARFELPICSRRKKKNRLFLLLEMPPGFDAKRQSQSPWWYFPQVFCFRVTTTRQSHGLINILSPWPCRRSRDAVQCFCLRVPRVAPAHRFGKKLGKVQSMIITTQARRAPPPSPQLGVPPIVNTD